MPGQLIDQGGTGAFAPLRQMTTVLPRIFIGPNLRLRAAMMAAAYAVFGSTALFFPYQTDYHKVNSQIPP
jgi:hypothetical protein